MQAPLIQIHYFRHTNGRSNFNNGMAHGVDGQLPEKHVIETGVSMLFAVMGRGKHFETPGLWGS